MNGILQNSIKFILQCFLKFFSLLINSDFELVPEFSERETEKFPFSWIETNLLLTNFTHKEIMEAPTINFNFTDDDGHDYKLEDKSNKSYAVSFCLLNYFKK